MSVTPRCEQCGQLVPPRAPGGLCPRCLLEQAVGASGEAWREVDVPGALAGTAGFVPRRFGDYELIEKIADGGMGVVYRARQLSLNRIVAVKMIQPGRVGSAEMVLRFRAEAEAAASLHHPHIVPIHETGECEGQHYFSMDYIEGRNLAEAVREGPLPSARAAHIVAQIAAAVHYAHAQGLLHRDLKPSNVILDEAGEPRVTDFGLARRLGGDSTLTLNGQVFGSPRFMPPEQASGRPGAVGVRSDVYGLGAILYYLLTARPPFVGETLETTLAQVLDQDPVAPRLLNASVPRDLETICLKCLEKEPARRYPTAQAVADELGRFLRHEPIRARAVSRPERAWRWCRRQPALAASLGAVALVGAIGSAGILLQWRRAEVQRGEALQSRVQAEAERYAADIGLAQILIEQQRFDRAREILARQEQQGGRGWEWGWLQRQCNLDLMTLKGHTGVVSCVAFSPDGRYLTTGGFDRTARLWELATGREVRLLGAHAGSIKSIAFSPDGQRVVTAGLGPDKTARVWEVAATGPESHRLTNDDGVIEAVFSPNGSTIATAGEFQGLKLWDARSGARLPVRADHEQSVFAVGFSPDGQRVAYGGGRAFPVDNDMGSAWLGDTDPGTAISLLDLKTGERRTFNAHRRTIARVRFSPDGRTLATSSWDGTARLWDIGTLSERRPLQAEFGREVIFGLDFSSDGRWLAVAGGVGGWFARAQAFEIASGRLVRSFDGHSGAVSDIVFSTDGTQVATASFDGTARVWSAGGVREYLSLEGHDQPVWTIAFSPDGKRLASGSLDQTARVWDTETASSLASFEVGFPVISLAWSADGERLVTVGPDHTACIWTVQASRESDGRLRSEACTENPKARNPESRTDQSLLTSAAANTEPVRLRGHTGTVMAVAWSTDGSLILTGSKDGTARLWDARAGALIRTVAAQTNWVLSVAFSPAGQRFVTGSADHTACLWEMATGRRLTVLEGHNGWVQQVAFSPDGRRLATGGTDRRTRLWDADTGGLLLTMAEDHLTGISSLAFSPDGARLATAGAGASLDIPWLLDHTAIIWDLRSGQRLVKLDAHANTVVAVAFSPDGRRLATGSADHTVRIREAFPWQPEAFPVEAGVRLPEKVERFKRRYWNEKLRSAAWTVPLGAAPVQPGRRLEVSMYGEVNLPVERGTKRRPARPIPRRSSSTEANLIDLTAVFNASLDETWQPTLGLHYLDVNLSSLPVGVTNLAGVPFDLRGVVRLGRNVLSCSVFPTAVEIPIKRKFRRFHVLHGATTTTKDGTQVGTYRVHYREGGSVDLPIVYGQDVRDWGAFEPGAPDADALTQTTAAEVAWTVTAAGPVASGDQLVRLYRRTYENPAPEREVTRITFESSLTATGPFLVAMTVEKVHYP